jgi:2-methylisocitrate lyase-like PEP mutase family enzyme
MLMHIIQLTEDEDDSYEFQDNTEQSDAYINIHQVASVTADDENSDRCFVYMANEDYFYVNESMDNFIARYQAILYGTVLTKFYDNTNKHN